MEDRSGGERRHGGEERGEERRHPTGAFVIHGLQLKGI